MITFGTVLSTWYLTFVVGLGIFAMRFRREIGGNIRIIFLLAFCWPVIPLGIKLKKIVDKYLIVCTLVSYLLLFAVSVSRDDNYIDVLAVTIILSLITTSSITLNDYFEFGE